MGSAGGCYVWQEVRLAKSGDVRCGYDYLPWTRLRDVMFCLHVKHERADRSSREANRMGLECLTGELLHLAHSVVTSIRVQVAVIRGSIRLLHQLDRRKGLNFPWDGRGRSQTRCLRRTRSQN